MLRRLNTSVVTFVQSFFLPESQLSSAQKWVLGLVNLGAVVVFWVLSSFLVNDLFESNVYRKPFFMTWINTSCFIFYLIPYLKYEGLTIGEFLSLLREDFYRPNAMCLADLEQSSPKSSTYGSSSDDTLVALLEIEAVDSKAQQDEDVGLWETVLLSFKFVLFWFLANLVTNASLSYTSVASQTILSSTSSFFTLLVGAFYGIEKINKNKVFGILLSFSGVILVSKIDSWDESVPDGAPSSLSAWGNILALVGALIYGLYTILLKHKISKPNSTSERILNTHLFFGFVGLFSLTMLWPLILVLHYTGAETFQFPNTYHILLILAANAFITFISDFCWCKAVLLTSPLTVTVGLSLTIPLAMVGDWIFRGFHINPMYMCGAAAVTLGFLVINKDEKEDFVAEE
ncbi:hypothetical protein PUMCH_004139 [Australozyma saopauloensis]|uniref:EamA domain-containing protein n=1 Tax=Australozyma saopauloensis TaxID=291208 RepID=A0AAX4HE25_9ASCO|nr:hypothetical protein PUMCH_004139 [[Candida] saopauloensis]